MYIFIMYCKFLYVAVVIKTLCFVECDLFVVFSPLSLLFVSLERKRVKEPAQCLALLLKCEFEWRSIEL